MLVCFVSDPGIGGVQQENQSVDDKTDRVFLHIESFKTAARNQTLPGEKSFLHYNLFAQNGL